jgi:hypothetical protein
VLLSVRHDGVLAATALCTPPRDLIVSGLQRVFALHQLAPPGGVAIYPRIGFRPMHDAVEIAFGQRRDSAPNGG